MRVWGNDLFEGALIPYFNFIMNYYYNLLVSAAGGSGERENTLNQLLVEMDGFNSETGGSLFLLFFFSFSLSLPNPPSKKKTTIL